MTKTNISVVHSIRVNQYSTISQDDVRKLKLSLRKFRRRIYADDDLIVERDAVAQRLIERIDEELMLNIGTGEHRLVLEQISNNEDGVEFIISGLSVNDQVVPYTQDSFHQITFNID